MGEWLQEWAQVISAFGTVLTMLVWVFYFHFAIFAYLGQRRARVVIDQTEDRSLNTSFVVVNLSEQPVYISCVMVVVKAGDDEKVTRIDTYRHFLGSDDDWTPQQVEAELRHGTLGPADLLMLGGSDRLLSWLLDKGDDEDFDDSREERLGQALSEIDWFDLRIIAMVGNDDRPIASRRRFLISADDGDTRIYPEFNQTQHFNSWWSRNTAAEWSEQCLRG